MKCVTVLFFIALQGVLFYVQASDIFSAIAADDASAIKVAIQKNRKSLNTPGSGGQSPLMNAVLSGKVNAVKALLLEGADVTIAEKDGYTPMVNVVHCLINSSM